MVDEFHQPLAPRFVSRLDKNRPDGMDAEGLFISLLLLDEVVVSAKLSEHVGQDHGAAVRLVEEVGELPILWAILEAQRKESIRFDWHSLSLVNFLPKQLAAMPRRSDLRHFGLVAGDLPTLTPGLKCHDTARLPACHLDHEMHPRDHKPVVQKPELHVLTASRCTGIVLLTVAADLLDHLWVDFKPPPLGQQAERLAIVEVVVELAVGSETGERPASDEATLPKSAQSPVSDILIASCQPHNLCSRTESVPQDGIQDVQIAVGNLSGSRGFGPGEFGELGCGHSGRLALGG
jgi:hypothetical protein